MRASTWTRTSEQWRHAVSSTRCIYFKLSVWIFPGKKAVDWCPFISLTSYEGRSGAAVLSPDARHPARHILQVLSEFFSDSCSVAANSLLSFWPRLFQNPLLSYWTRQDAHCDQNIFLFSARLCHVGMYIMTDCTLRVQFEYNCRLRNGFIIGNPSAFSWNIVPFLPELPHFFKKKKKTKHKNRSKLFFYEQS